MRPIDADKLEEKVRKQLVQIAPIAKNRDMFYYDSGVNCGLYGAIVEIDCAPTLEMEPVRHGQWISVKDRLPEIVEEVKAWNNVYRRSQRVLCSCLQKSGKKFVKEGYMEFFNDYPTPDWRIPGNIHSVTHWMPLPEPYREDEDNGQD